MPPGADATPWTDCPEGRRIGNLRTGPRLSSLRAGLPAHSPPSRGAEQDARGGRRTHVQFGPLA
eukprot:5095885-Alexandrium_andersonii.AAC.1